MHRLPGYMTSILCCSMLVACGPNPQNQLKSAQEPHRPIAGPSFEGWYARTSDLGGGRSLAVIVGSHRAKNQTLSEGQSGPGYIGVLYSEGNGSPTRSWSYFPEETRITREGKPVTSDPSIFDSEDRAFAWEAPGFGSFHQDRIALALPGGVEVSMEFDAGKSWDAQGQLPLGPESALAALPLPLHWYVKSLRSPAHYRLKFTDSEGRVQDIEGRGQAHLEKNWGQVFPKEWNWLQADSIDEDAQIALGGGTIKLGFLDLKALLAGYRSPKESWDIRFTDLGTQIETKAGDCQGTYEVHVQRPDLEVFIRAFAPRDTYGTVAVPTDKGFIPDFGAESFSARIEVSTYRPRLTGKQMTDFRVFENGALEFGAGSYNKNCS